jgi:hypothetical protein
MVPDATTAQAARQATTNPRMQHTTALMTNAHK